MKFRSLVDVQGETVSQGRSHLSSCACRKGPGRTVFDYLGWLLIRANKPTQPTDVCLFFFIWKEKRGDRRKRQILRPCSKHFICIISFQFSRSVVSDSLRPQEPQHARPPCPSPTPGDHPNPWPLSRWCHPTISPSVIPFSSCLPSFPASGSFQMSQFFTSGGQRDRKSVV